MSGQRKRICEICSAEYRPTYGEQRTCSRPCGAELQRRNCALAGKGYAGKPLERACRRCGQRSPVVTRQNRLCDGCRAHAPRRCAGCRKPFKPLRANSTTCSPECRRRYASAMLSAYIMRRYHAESDFRDRMLAAAHSRRADKIGAGAAKILLAYLIKRDRARCGICHKPVRARKGPMRPSIDHIVPLSRGGTHDLANVQLAHYHCNLSKNNRGSGEQLLLFG